MKVVDKKPEEDQKLDQKDKGKEGKQYEVSASKFSRLIFAWMTPHFKLGSTRYLEQADIPEYFEEDTANNCFERFEQEWKAIEKDLEKQAMGRGAPALLTRWAKVQPQPYSHAST